jgi:hypothetical protein
VVAAGALTMRAVGSPPLASALAFCALAMLQPQTSASASTSASPAVLRFMLKLT